MLMKFYSLSIVAAIATAQAQKCQPGPGLSTPYKPDVSSPDNFRKDTSIASVADGAVTPSGWNLNYKNKQAASIADGYITYTYLSTYDPSICASYCKNLTDCQSFNIYFQRDPSLVPAIGCSDPSPVATVKCAMFKSALTPESANNDGQFEEDFIVAIAGSNAYTLIPTDKCKGAVTITQTSTSTVTKTTTVTASSSLAGIFGGAKPAAVPAKVFPRA